jgi:hypothetical protein
MPVGGPKPSGQLRPATWFDLCFWVEFWWAVVYISRTATPRWPGRS